MSAERVLIDTNVFVYAMDEASPRCAVASTFLDAVTSGGFFGCIAPQVCAAGAPRARVGRDESEGERAAESLRRRALQISQYVKEVAHVVLRMPCSDRVRAPPERLHPLDEGTFFRTEIRKIHRFECVTDMRACQPGMT